MDSKNFSNSALNNSGLSLSSDTPKPAVQHRMAMCDNAPRCKAIRPKGSLLRCGGCNSVFYCDTKCQKAHWTKGGHSAKCSAMAARYKRKLEKRKRQAAKLRKAKKEAEASNASFNASLTLMFMDSDDDDSDSGGNDFSNNNSKKLLGSSRLSYTEEEHSGKEENSDVSFNLAGLTLEPERP